MRPRVAVERAGIALLRVFGSFWPVLLPYVARKRSEDLTDPLRALADTLSWPVLRDPVGVPTRNTYPSQHFSVWWPLDVETRLRPPPRRLPVVERVSLVAARRGRHTTDGNRIAFTERWVSPGVNSITEDAARQRRAPALYITEAVQAEYAEGFERSSRSRDSTRLALPGS